MTTYTVFVDWMDATPHCPVFTGSDRDKAESAAQYWIRKGASLVTIEPVHFFTDRAPIFEAPIVITGG